MSGASAREPGGARLALAVLTAVYVLNYLDRQILSILAEDVKRDLGLSDAQIGFLYGTAFAVFYAVFGLPLGRLADTWTRTRVITAGLGVWSLMTTVSGLARTFPQLALARFGVGIGEASANPASFSLIADYFRPERRATAMAVYQTGLYIGSGLGLGIGGLVVTAGITPSPRRRPCSGSRLAGRVLRGRRAGLVLAPWSHAWPSPSAAGSTACGANAAPFAMPGTGVGGAAAPNASNHLAGWRRRARRGERRDRRRHRDRRVGAHPLARQRRAVDRDGARALRRRVVGARASAP
jgi:MFS family permease